MNIPFTVNEFLEIFAHYNQAIWPGHIFFYLLGVAAVILTVRETGFSDRTVGTILSFFWLWMGVVYHLIFFSRINPAAFVFGGLFVIQGFLFFIYGTVMRRISFSFAKNVYAVFGVTCIVYAMMVYPIFGHLFGHTYPQTPVFGVAPCPTVIFTFGILLLTDKRVPKILLFIPFLWSCVGFSAAISLGIKEDFGLIVAGVVGTILLFIRDRNEPSVGL